MKERDYQGMARRSTHQEWREFQSTLVQMPTGTGKTILACGIINDRFPGRSLFIAHREEIVFQSARAIEKVTGFNVGIEMGDLKVSKMFGLPRVVVATVQTLAAGGDG